MNSGTGTPSRPWYVWGTMAALLALMGEVLTNWDPGAPDRREPPPLNDLITSDMVPLVTGDEKLETLFTRAGCPVCHVIPGIPGAKGKVGPPLVMGDVGPRRLHDPSYRGQAENVRDYVVESILTPSAYVVQGYPDHTMPTWYGKKLTAKALEKIAAYLKTLRAGTYDGVKSGGEDPLRDRNVESDGMDRASVREDGS